MLFLRGFPEDEQVELVVVGGYTLKPPRDRLVAGGGRPHRGDGGLSVAAVGERLEGVGQRVVYPIEYRGEEQDGQGQGD